MRKLIVNIITQLQDIQEASLWMGENFDKKLSALNEVEAFTRPHTKMHSPAEIISHLTVWRKEAILKITTGTGSITDESEENWLSNDKLRRIGWDRIKNEYGKSLSKLVELLKVQDDDFLMEKYYDTDFKGYYDYSFLINGMLHHDIYHLGQLGIIIKLIKEN